MKASQYYKSQIVNVISQQWNKDGSVIVTLYKKGWKKPRKFKAKNLYRKDEDILEDEEIEA